MAETQTEQRSVAAAGAPQAGAAQGESNVTRPHMVAAVTTLCVGAAAAVGLSFGNVWMSRAGIFVAALAGLAALLMVLRDLSASEDARSDAERSRSLAQQGWQHAEQARLDAERAAAERIRTMERHHHDESMGIIERFSHRVSELGAEITGLQAELARLRAELERSERLVASLRSTQQVLLDNAVEARGRIARLEQELSVREAELEQLAASQPVAEVVALPVRPQLLADAGEHGDVVWDEAVGH